MNNDIYVNLRCWTLRIESLHILHLQLGNTAMQEQQNQHLPLHCLRVAAMTACHDPVAVTRSHNLAVYTW